jgi:hypothetical protein
MLQLRQLRLHATQVLQCVNAAASAPSAALLYNLRRAQPLQWGDPAAGLVNKSAAVEKLLHKRSEKDADLQQTSSSLRPSTLVNAFGAISSGGAPRALTPKEQSESSKTLVAIV